MMRTLIQKALDPQVGDRMFFSNQVRIRSGETDFLSIYRIVREVLRVPEDSTGHIVLRTNSSQITLSKKLFLEKYSPELDAQETALNRVQKLFILLAFHGFHQELMDLIVQVEI